MLDRLLMRRLVGAAVGALAAFVCMTVSLRIADWLRDPLAAWPMITFDVLPILAPVAGALAGGYFAVRPVPGGRKEASYSRVRVVRALFALLVTLYGATWVFGVPAAITDHLEVASSEQRNFLSWSASQGEPTSPARDAFVAVRLALPVLPGVVVLHVQTVGAGPCDWSGWSLVAWVPGHVRRLATRYHWMT